MAKPFEIYFCRELHPPVPTVWMRLPQPVITRFEKRLYDHERVLYMVPDTSLYFRVPVDPVETNFSELFYWSFCVSEAMRAVSQN